MLSAAMWIDYRIVSKKCTVRNKNLTHGLRSILIFGKYLKLANQNTKPKEYQNFSFIGFHTYLAFTREKKLENPCSVHSMTIFATERKKRREDKNRAHVYRNQNWPHFSRHNRCSSKMQKNDEEHNFRTVLIFPVDSEKKIITKTPIHLLLQYLSICCMGRHVYMTLVMFKNDGRLTKKKHFQNGPWIIEFLYRRVSQGEAQENRNC